MTRAHGTSNPFQQELDRRAAMVEQANPAWAGAWHQGYAEVLMAFDPPAGGASEWRSDVEDATGRDREVQVASAANRVNFLPPPGAGFSMDPDQADRLAIALQCAANRARQLARPTDDRQAGTTAYWRRHRSG
jgi:hypothetical protein